MTMRCSVTVAHPTLQDGLLSLGSDSTTRGTTKGGEINSLILVSFGSGMSRLLFLGGYGLMDHLQMCVIDNGL